MPQTIEEELRAEIERLKGIIARNKDVFLNLQTEVRKLRAENEGLRAALSAPRRADSGSGFAEFLDDVSRGLSGRRK
jgi:hypothetical protein